MPPGLTTRSTLAAASAIWIAPNMMIATDRLGSRTLRPVLAIGVLSGGIKLLIAERRLRCPATRRGRGGTDRRRPQPASHGAPGIQDVGRGGIDLGGRHGADALGPGLDVLDRASGRKRGTEAPDGRRQAVPGIDRLRNHPARG